MDTAARVIAFLAGASLVIATLASAVKTVIVPRADPTLLTRVVFVTLRKPFDLRVARTRTWEQADAVMARFAPFALLALPFAWVTLVILGFAPVFWALGAEPRDALVVSGSSLLTLGFAVDLHGDAVAVTFVEATLGLGLVALLISFLPSIYQQFSHREVLVSQLETRAGSPPAPIKLFRRAHRIHWDMEELWTDWELWFAEVQESHTSYLALPYFRSPRHNLSWITSAGRSSTPPPCGRRRWRSRGRGRPSCASGRGTWRCGASPTRSTSRTTTTPRPATPSRSSGRSTTSWSTRWWRPACR